MGNILRPSIHLNSQLRESEPDELQDVANQPHSKCSEARLCAGTGIRLMCPDGGRSSIKIAFEIALKPGSAQEGYQD